MSDVAYAMLEHFYAWLKPQIIGCRFAAKVIAARQVVSLTLPSLGEEHLAEIAAVGRAGASESKTVLLLFPSVTQEQGLVALLNLLAQQADWRCAVVDTPDPASMALALEWVTPAGALSRAMGFAPLLSMPPLRRGPYVAMALWPGGHENTRKQSGGRHVSLADAKLDPWFPMDQYQAAWEQSQRDANRMTPHPYQGMPLRRITFVVDAKMRGGFSHLDPRQLHLF